MSLANFSLPFQTVTPSPFLYAGNEGRSIINNLRLNAVLTPPPAPTFTEDTQYRNDPYIRYQQQQQQQTQKQQRYRQAPPRQPQQLRGREVFTGATSSFSSARSFSSQDTRYTGYDQDFRRTQPRQEQQQQRPPLLPQTIQQQQQIPQQIPQQLTQQLSQQIPQLQQQQLEQQQIEQQQQQRIPIQQERDQLPSPTDPRDKSQENYPERPTG